MRTSLLGALAICLMFGGVTATDAKAPNPFFKGLEKAKVTVSVSQDVKTQLWGIGAPNFVLGSELQSLAESKLHEAGIATGGSDKGPRISIVSDIDINTDEFTLTLAYYDYVALVRDSDIKFETLLWSKKAHPSIDEARALKEVLTDLLEQFIAERVMANPDKK